MCLCAFEVRLKGRKRLAWVTGAVFLAFSVVFYEFSFENGVGAFLLGASACTSVVLLAAGAEERIGSLWCVRFLTSYSMPVFLMHTLFAAPVRIFLLKAGINGGMAHIAAGLAAGFIGPALAAEIMRKLKVPEFLLYPGKFIPAGNESKSKGL